MFENNKLNKILDNIQLNEAVKNPGFGQNQNVLKLFI